MISEMVISELYDAASEEYRTIAVDRWELVFDALMTTFDEPDQNEFFFLALGYIEANYDIDTSQAKIDTYYSK
jgi:hypothetical protein